MQAAVGLSLLVLPLALVHVARIQLSQVQRVSVRILEVREQAGFALADDSAEPHTLGLQSLTTSWMEPVSSIPMVIDPFEATGDFSAAGCKPMVSPFPTSIKAQWSPKR